MEEQATLVSLQEDGNMKNMDDKVPDFFKSHNYLETSNPWKDKNSSLASKDCKRKANCEGNEFSPSFFVGEHQISAKEGDVVHNDKVDFM